MSRSVCESAATSADSDGWLVVPDIGAAAASTASAPAALAASRVASCPPAVSCVCTCTGTSKRSRSARDETGCRGRPQQPRHVLDREDVRARLDDLLGEAQVVVERVEVLGRVQQVAGVADGDLGDGGAGREHGVDRRAHLVDVVERVEDAEDVDAARGGLADERVGDLGRVRRVAHGVAAAQQHLDRDVRQRGAQAVEALPRVFAEEAERDVVRRAAPRLDRQQLRASAARRTGRRVTRSFVRTRVASSDWCASRKVVSVTASGGLLAQRPGEAGGAELEQALAGSRRAASARRSMLRQLQARVDGERVLAVRLVDRRVDEPVEHLAAAVLRLAAAQQLRGARR